MQKINKARGNLIRAFRESLEMNQEQFGELLSDEDGSFGRTAVAQWERGCQVGIRAAQQLTKEAKKNNFELTYEQLFD